MNILLELSDIDIKNIFFNEPTKNNIIFNSSFIRIYYSNKIFTTNGIYIKININKIDEVINDLEALENSILNLLNLQYTTFNHKIKKHIKYHINKIITSNNNYFIIKLSGIWINNEVGINYKFIY